MADGHLKASSSTSGKRAESLCLGLTRIFSFELHDPHTATVGAVHTAVQGAEEPAKHSQPSSSPTSPSGETDDGERRRPHSFPKRAAKGSENTTRGRATKFTACTCTDWNVLDAVGYYTTEIFDTCEVEKRIPPGAPLITMAALTQSPLHPASLVVPASAGSTMTSSSVPSSTASRTRRRSHTTSAATIPANALLPSTAPTHAVITATPAPSAKEGHAEAPVCKAGSAFPHTVRCSRSLPRAATEAAALAAASTQSKDRLSHLAVVKTSPVSLKQKSPSICVTSPVTGDTWPLPPLCWVPSADSPHNGCRIPSPSQTAPRSSLSAPTDPFAHTPTRFHAQKRLSSGQDALVDFLQGPWRHRAASQFSAGEAQAEMSLSSPYGEPASRRSSQRPAVRLSVSEQLSVASDVTFVDHGESGLFNSLRTIGSASTNTAIVAVWSQNQPTAEAYGGSGTPLQSRDEAVCGPTSVSSRVTTAALQKSDALTPQRALPLISPGAEALVVRSSSGARAVRRPVTPPAAPRLTRPQLSHTSAPPSVYVESDLDTPSASTLTARPTESTARASAGATTVSKSTLPDGVMVGLSGSSRGRASCHAQTTGARKASIRHATGFALANNAPEANVSGLRSGLSDAHGQSKKTASLAQYHAAVKYAQTHDCALTMKELLAKGCAVGVNEEEDEEDEEDDVESVSAQPQRRGAGVAATSGEPSHPPSSLHTMKLDKGSNELSGEASSPSA